MRRQIIWFGGLGGGDGEPVTGDADRGVSQQGRAFSKKLLHRRGGEDFFFSPYTFFLRVSKCHVSQDGSSWQTILISLGGGLLLASRGPR